MKVKKSNSRVGMKQGPSVGARIIEGLEEAVDRSMPKHSSRFGRDRGKFHVAIALHRLLQAAEQDVNRLFVHLPDFGAVEHNARPIVFEAALKLRKEELAPVAVNARRQLSHGNGLDFTLCHGKYSFILIFVRVALNLSSRFHQASTTASSLEAF